MLRSRAIRVLCVTLLLAVCCGATAALGSVGASRLSVAGTWSGRYSGTFSGTFTLRWRLYGSTLRGTIALSKPHGTYGITGSVHRNAISFGAVAVGATYTGSVFGTKMSGSYKTPQGNGTWSAKKISTRIAR